MPELSSVSEGSPFSESLSSSESDVDGLYSDSEAEKRSTPSSLEASSAIASVLLFYCSSNKVV